MTLDGTLTLRENCFSSSRFPQTRQSLPTIMLASVWVLHALFRMLSEITVLFGWRNGSLAGDPLTILLMR